MSNLAKIDAPVISATASEFSNRPSHIGDSALAGNLPKRSIAECAGDVAKHLALGVTSLGFGAAALPTKQVEAGIIGSMVERENYNAMGPTARFEPMPNHTLYTPHKFKDYNFNDMRPAAGDSGYYILPPEPQFNEFPAAVVEHAKKELRRIDTEANVALAVGSTILMLITSLTSLFPGKRSDDSPKSEAQPDKAS